MSVTIAYILLYTWAGVGYTPAFLGEYANKEACEQAAKVINASKTNLACVPKWVREKP
ncbi:hypothetical protein P3W85_29905 [Cupriavidus basilensis]|uniref:Phage protein n=1 Tax=Cupriavidus basilensis TaxID=68895 RepID=A0ABT6AX29_9BURK|nr:hypothetical protein [Cupriavidus basilensis]MDF3837138.1 hypothetical protein [Cupriavidus basilensis]